MKWYWIILIAFIGFFLIKFLLAIDRGFIQLLGVIVVVLLILYGFYRIFAYASQDFKYN